MTFDNFNELNKIKENHPTAKLVLRICFDAKKALLSFGEKFGCDPGEEALELISNCKEMDLSLIGISFHAGNDVGDHQVFEGAIRAMRKLFDFAESLGMKLNFLDIGGGFSGLDMDQFERCAHFINIAIDECFPDPNVEIISEPGFYFMQNSMKLVCNIHSKRVQRGDNGKILHIHYFINDGIFTSFMGHYIFKFHPSMKTFRPSQFMNENQTFHSTFWGQTCSAIDKVFSDELPEMKIDDWIIFENVGAYTFCGASEFNGFPVSEIVALETPGSRSLFQLNGNVELFIFTFLD